MVQLQQWIITGGNLRGTSFSAETSSLECLLFPPTQQHLHTVTWFFLHRFGLSTLDFALISFIDLIVPGE